jgi:hypothetical protein
MRAVSLLGADNHSSARDPLVSIKTKGSMITKLTAHGGRSGWTGDECETETKAPHRLE